MLRVCVLVCCVGSYVDCLCLFCSMTIDVDMCCCFEMCIGCMLEIYLGRGYIFFSRYHGISHIGILGFV